MLHLHGCKGYLVLKQSTQLVFGAESMSSVMQCKSIVALNGLCETFQDVRTTSNKLTSSLYRTLCKTADTNSGFLARSLEKLSSERACKVSRIGSAKRAPSSSCNRASVLDRFASGFEEAPLLRGVLQTAGTTASINKTAASNCPCCSCSQMNALPALSFHKSLLAWKMPYLQHVGMTGCQKLL